MIRPRKRGIGCTPLYGLGGIVCLRSDPAGNCTLIDDSASDITVNVTPEGSTYQYTESGKAITFGAGGIGDWLNQNAMKVAIGLVIAIVGMKVISNR